MIVVRVSHPTFDLSLRSAPCTLLSGAYSSNESSRVETYVRPFPPRPRKWQVSTNGGLQPSWSAEGKGVFYVEGSALMAVPVTGTPGPLSTPQPTAAARKRAARTGLSRT